jgi:IMP dehydrogenase
MFNIPLALTFDDVLLVPQYTEILSRQNVNLKTKISKNVSLNIPFVSSNMDTVTEDKMAIAIAREGGIGIIHRYCSINDEVEMVKKVKRAESYIIDAPYTAFENDTINDIKHKITSFGVNSYLIIDKNNYLKGILTSRDIKFTNNNQLVKNCMTPINKMIYCTNENINMENAKQIMCKNKIQKLPIIDNEGKLKSLICLKDIERIEHRPNANLDSYGRLKVGAAIGVKEDALERATKLVEVGVDVLVIDIAHGNSKLCIDTIINIKKKLPNIDIIAGNIATADGALNLIKAGADGLKVGIGSGSICTTRLTAGAGVPQLTALLDVYSIAKNYNIPIISDGGNRHYGNLSKALGAGADCIMLGRMIAGSEESPGKVLIKDGKRVKIIRGMAGIGANISNAQRQGLKEPDLLDFTPEGVEGYVPYTGPLKDSLKQMCDAIRSGMSYTGVCDISEIHIKAKFIRQTQNGKSESGIHDIVNI